MAGNEEDLTDLQQQQQLAAAQEARLDSLQLETSNVAQQVEHLSTLLTDLIAAQTPPPEVPNNNEEPHLADPELHQNCPTAGPLPALSGSGSPPSEFEFASAPVHLYPSEKAQFVEWLSQPMPKGYAACAPSVTAPAAPHIYAIDDLASRSLHAKGHQATLTEYNIVTCGGFFLEVACSSIAELVNALADDTPLDNDVLLDHISRVYNTVKSVSTVLNNRGTCIAVKTDTTASDEATDYCKLELSPTFEPAPQGLERLGPQQLANFEAFKTNVKRSQFTQQAKAIAANRVHAKSGNPKPPAAAAAPKVNSFKAKQQPAEPPKPAAAPRAQPPAPRRQIPAAPVPVDAGQAAEQAPLEAPRAPRRG